MDQDQVDRRAEVVTLQANLVGQGVLPEVPCAVPEVWLEALAVRAVEVFLLLLQEAKTHSRRDNREGSRRPDYKEEVALAEEVQRGVAKEGVRRRCFGSFWEKYQDAEGRNEHSTEVVDALDALPMPRPASNYQH